jgi:hypothetical protein
MGRMREMRFSNNRELGYDCVLFLKENQEYTKKDVQFGYGFAFSDAQFQRIEIAIIPDSDRFELKIDSHPERLVVTGVLHTYAMDGKLADFIIKEKELRDLKKNSSWYVDVETWLSIWDYEKARNWAEHCNTKEYVADLR